jgi:hypothetical protein
MRLTQRITWLNQRYQTLSGHDLIHLDQEALAVSPLTFAGVVGIGEQLLYLSSIVAFESGSNFTESGSFSGFPSGQSPPIASL